ncbi:MAG: hypothetical protein P8I51_06715 [Polaribacter sp.]|jgi:hypothetical protein|nr:hypothetical protein [Polaribacter sp.]MDG1954567.1 hypothetical protein [Polaribacter sp.]
MKKSIKNNSLLFSLLFALAISFIACSDDNATYKKEIETADAFFKKQQYDEAKTYYLKAAKLNTEETYPTNQVAKINTIISEIKVKLEKKVEEVKPIVTETKITVKNPYLVVIASYAIASNATAHQKKLNSKGYTTSIVKSSKGNFLLSIQSFSTLTKSYNYLESLDMSDDYDIDEAWVYEIK